MERGFAVSLPSIGKKRAHRSDFGATLAEISPFTYAVMRIGAGLMFMEHGLQKVFGMFGGFGGTAGATAPLASQMGLAGILELVGGTLIALGLLTRPVALVLAIEMIIAYLQAHLPKGGWPIQNGGELALLYAVVFLFLAGHGGGPASVDRRMGRS